MVRSTKKDFVFLLLWGSYALLTVPVFWENNTLTGLLLIIGSVGILLYWPGLTKNMIIFFAAGLLGVAVEFILTSRLGLWHYSNPSIIHLTGTLTVRTLPWWLFFVWGYLIVLFIHASYTIEKAVTAVSAARFRTVINTGITILWVIMIIYFALIYKELRFDLTRWFLLIIIPFMIFWRKKIDLISFFTAGILGTFGEWICMQSGTWTYSSPYFAGIGIPLSLPLAWGLVTVLLRRLSLLFYPKQTEAQACTESI